MKCKHCGKEVPDRAKVCGYCGTPLKKKAAVVKPKPTVQAPVKKTKPKLAPVKKVPEKKAPAKTGSSPMGDLAVEIKKMPLWAWIVGAVAVGLVAVLLLTSGGGDLTLLEGRWKGTVENKLDGSTFEITFVFPHDCELNEYCGRISIPEFSLSSEVMINDMSGKNYQFFVLKNEDLEEDEVPDEYLRYVNADQLEFHSLSDDWDEQGTLYKQ